VARTGPYFHDGSVATLDDAISKMGEHQLGKTLTAEQVTQIKSFLGSLTGPLPADGIQPPTLPESGPRTPKPDPT
jgi:cytochrome c peroxidase